MKSKIFCALVIYMFFIVSCSPRFYVTRGNKEKLEPEQKAWVLKQWKAWLGSTPKKDFSAVGRSWSAYDASAVLRSRIITTNNDTIRGLAKLWPVLKHSNNYYGSRDTIRYYIMLLPDGKNIETGLLPVDIKQVNYFRVYDRDSIANNYRFIDIVNLTNKNLGKIRREVSGIPDYPSLWRQIGRKDSIGIYDNNQFFWNNLTSKGKTILLRGENATTMYSWWSHQWHRRTALLLKYINRNYNQHFDKGYFKDEKAELDYILNRENERMKG